MASERFLIIGALGCIGAWSTKRLLDEGADVVSYDLPGEPHRLKLLLSADQLAKVTFVNGDVTNPAALEQAIVEHGITHVIHLAALQVPSVRANPILGMNINVVGTTIVFESVKKHKDQVQGLAYASSVAVYGPANRYPAGPIAHDAPLLPETLYGVSKEANEGTAEIYWLEHGVRSIGVRPAFVYGPGRDVGMTSTPTKAMLAAAAGRPYHISFGGTGFFQHADDVAKALIAGTRAGIDGAPCYNLGGTSVEISAVVDAIDAAAPEMEGMITFEPIQLPFPAAYDGEPLDRAIGPVGWRPFAQGAKQTVDFFKQAIAAGRIDVDRGIA